MSRCAAGQYESGRGEASCQGQPPCASLGADAPATHIFASHPEVPPVAQITQPELQSLHELIWMEAAMYEKFRAYAEHASEEHVRKLCDQLADRTRQHLTALSQLLDTGQTGVH